MRWAIINLQTNIVENIIIWDGLTQIFPTDSSSLIQLEENERCSSGDLYQENNTPRFIEQENN